MCGRYYTLPRESTVFIPLLMALIAGLTVSVSQTLLDYHPDSSIGLRLWSKPFPIHLSSRRLPVLSGCRTWRLNDNVLSNSLCIQAITQAIRNFSHTHASDTTSPLAQWESLKCVNQGTNPHSISSL